MKIIISLICCLISISSFSQEINFEWNKIFNSSNYNHAYCAANDSDGFIYVAGNFENVFEIESSSMESEKGKDGFLLKLNPNGDLIWSKHFSSSSDVNITSLDIDKDNQLILVGEYKNSVVFDVTIETNNTDKKYSSNMFLAKYDSNGNLLWAKNNGGIANGKGNLTVLANNDILLFGTSIDFNLFDTDTLISTLDSALVDGPGFSYWAFAHSESDFMARISPDGSLKWIKEFGGYVNEVILDNHDNIVVTGSFFDDTYFDEILVSEIGSSTSFLAHYSSEGEINWVRTSGGSTNHNAGYGLSIDSQNNIYQCGTVGGQNIKFDGETVLNYTHSNSYLTKYDDNGNLVWYQIFGTITSINDNSAEFSRGIALKTDNNGNILMLGYFQDKITFGMTTIDSEASQDLMLLKFNQNGNVIEAKEYVEYGSVVGIDLAIDDDNAVYIIGNKYGVTGTMIDPSNSFVGKIDKSTFTSIEKNIDAHNLSVYPNPSIGNIHVNSSKIGQTRKIEIVSIDGRKIKEFSTQDSNFSFEFDEKGIFIISVTIDGNRVTRRIVVE